MNKLAMRQIELTRMLGFFASPEKQKECWIPTVQFPCDIWILEFDDQWNLMKETNSGYSIEKIRKIDKFHEKLMDYYKKYLRRVQERLFNIHETVLRDCDWICIQNEAKKLLYIL